MIYVAIIGLSALLLFQVQPMLAKIILPIFGGGASIWLTCIIFFQLVLLAGYYFCHLFSRKLGYVKFLIYQAVITAVALFFIPLPAQVDHLRLGTSMPAFDIFFILLATVGLPYFVLSTTSPTVQYWIARNLKSEDQNPYIQYAVSNFGSLLGLLSYPLWVERVFDNNQQTNYWSYAFGLYCLLVFITVAYLLYQSKDREKEDLEEASPQAKKEEAPPWPRRIQWLFWSMIPSAALLIITHHLTQDIVNFPLLWVIPLCLYLISFIVCFAFPQISKPNWIRTSIFLVLIVGLSPLIGFSFVLREILSLSLIWQIVISSLWFFAISMLFHGDLENDKPEPRHLTSFYFYLSLGAAIGSILVGIVAPLVFRSTFEFQLLVLIVVYRLLHPYIKELKNLYQRSCQVAFAVVAILTFLAVETTLHAPLTYITYKNRSFYSTYTQLEIPSRMEENPAVQVLLESTNVEVPTDLPARRSYRLLLQGTTIHGGQARDEKGNYLPITYYHRHTGVAQVLRKIAAKRIGVVGLGTGNIAVLAKKGQTMDFYEIDPLVVEIAKTRFENLKACSAETKIYVGDGRLELEKRKKDAYDILILDAFTSDSIPAHLITIDACREFWEIVNDKGVILYHISNHFVNMEPVLRGMAEKLDLHLKVIETEGDVQYFQFPTTWAVLTKDKETMEKITGANPDWRDAQGKKLYWRDNYSNIWSVLKFGD